jgi:hypothetical protein
MTQADRDAERWMQDNAKWQQRNLYRAKETGDPYYINAHGDVVIEKPKAKEGEEK